MHLVFDTETTGLPDWGAPSDAAHQPHIVQLAMILLDGAKRERAAVSIIVKPEGWIIPEDVVRVHGITTEIATAVGVPEKVAVSLFVEMLYGRRAQAVGHNISFDHRIMRIAMLRAGYTKEWLDANTKCESFCTMHKSRAEVNLGKAPKLVEAYRHFFGEEMQGAHDAMADARGAMRVFLHLTGHEPIQEIERTVMKAPPLSAEFDSGEIL